MIQTHFRRAAAAVMTCVAIVALAGCAGPGVDEAELGQFRTAVLQVTEAANQSDFDAALAELDALEKELAAAKADGTIPTDRIAEIEASIALVRADLQAAIEAAKVPAPEPSQPAVEEPSNPPDEKPDDSDKKDKDDKGNNGNGNDGDDNGGTPEPSETPSPEPTTPSPEPTTPSPEPTPES